MRGAYFLPTGRILTPLRKGLDAVRGWKKGLAGVLGLLLLCGCGGQDAVTADGAVELEKTAPMVAITFDDGPSSVTTPRLLDGLKERGVKATFFLVGSMAADNMSLVRRMAEEGHQLAVHTYDHSSQTGLTGLSQSEFDLQVGSTRDLLTAITGQTQFMLRPPYGFVDAGVNEWANAPIILWSVDPEDWADRNTARIVEHVLSNVKDGDIVLLHDIFSASVDAALQIIDALQAEGYELVTVEQLFAARGVTPENGRVYESLPPAG